jgi:hypothetical protein
MCTLFNSGDSGLYHIAASSKEEARAIAEDHLRSKGIPFRALLAAWARTGVSRSTVILAHRSGSAIAGFRCSCLIQITIGCELICNRLP